MKLPWKSIAAMLVTVAVSWYLFHGYLSGHWQFSNSASKFERGESGAMNQARVLLNHFKASGWDRTAIPREMKVLEDDRAANPGKPIREMSSFSFGLFPTSDELAFTSHYYAKKSLRVVKGIEGTVDRSGFVIVAFRDGRILKVPYDQERTYWVNGWDGKMGLHVYPGMRHYSQGVKAYEDAPLILPPLPDHIRKWKEEKDRIITANRLAREAKKDETLK